MRQGILEAFPEGEYELFVVWTNVLVDDAMKEALSSSAILVDRRATQFFDPELFVGRAFAPRTGLDSLIDILDRQGVDPAQLEVAFKRDYIRGEASIFDAIFFFDDEVTWGEEPPPSLDWITQLDPANYTGFEKEKFFWGDELTAELKRLAAKHLLAQKTDATDGG